MPTSVPDYQRIIDAIVRLIEVGELKPGDRLPTYAQLAVEYDVGVTTAAGAIRILRDRGLVTGRPGKGTYVAQPDVNS